MIAVIRVYRDEAGVAHDPEAHATPRERFYGVPVEWKPAVTGEWRSLRLASAYHGGRGLRARLLWNETKAVLDAAQAADLAETLR